MVEGCFGLIGLLFGFRRVEDSLLDGFYGLMFGLGDVVGVGFVFWRLFVCGVGCLRGWFVCFA